MELELELNQNRERELWVLVVEVEEEFHSLVLDSLEPDCLELDSLELGSPELDSLELSSPELGSLELDCEAPEALEVLLLGSGAGDGPQVIEVQLLSCCVRRLDTIVQVGTGRALLGRQQMEGD